MRKWAVFKAQNLNYEKDKLDKPEKEVNKMKKEITTIKEMKLHGTLNSLTERLNNQITDIVNNFIDYIIASNLRKHGYDDLNISAEINGNFITIVIFKETKKVGHLSACIKQGLLIDDDGKLSPWVEMPELVSWQWDNLFKELKENIE